MTIGVSVGGVWTTRDAGKHWELIGTGLRNAYMPPEIAGDPLTQDAHRVVQCPASPDRLWMQHHNGIFRSDDGGEHWQELKDRVLQQGATNNCLFHRLQRCGTFYDAD